MTAEFWVYASGWPKYQISTLGRVRYVQTKTIIPATTSNGYAIVKLTEESGKQRRIRVHRLLADSFPLPKTGGSIVCHRDGNRSNNALDNLYWGTYSDNNYDTVRHGNHRNARKTHCPKGHEYTEENTNYDKDGWRLCRACRSGAGRRPK